MKKHFAIFERYEWDCHAEDVVEIYYPLCGTDPKYHYPEMVETIEETTCKKCLKKLEKS